MSKACQLFSGSNGNSIYISSGSGKFLVDGGVTAKRLDNALAQIEVNPQELDGIFITHEHSDHIKGIRVFAKRHNIPVFAPKQVLAAMYQSGDLTPEIIATEIEQDMEIKGSNIKFFENSHDSVACVGYRFDMKDGRSISVCTDTGYITPCASQALMGSDLVYLESNHEITMLQNGAYPYPLKQRILSPVGHLSNIACSEFATELIKNGTTRIVLAHLSRENNTPENAYQTTLCALQGAGFKEENDFRLSVSAVENQGRPIVL